MRIRIRRFLSVRVLIHSGSRIFKTKNLELKKNFWIKYIKDVQATGEVFIPQIEQPKLRNLELFHFFCGSFLAAWIRIRIPNADPESADQNECGSGSTTLDK